MQALNLIIISFILIASLAHANESDDGSIKRFCLPNISKELCSQSFEMFKSVVGKEPKNIDEIHEFMLEELEKKSKDQTFVDAVLDSPIIKEHLTSLPFNTRFKVLDVNEGDSVLALEFDYNHQFSKSPYANDGGRMNNYGFEFDIRGTVTQEEEKNPRNFIESKLSFTLSSRPTFKTNTVMPALYSEEFVDECRTNRGIEQDPICFVAEKADFDALYASAGTALFFDYGLDVGYETDQAFNASNTTFSIFGSLTAQSFNSNSFMGHNGIVPSLRVAVESVEPSAETPRALSGDGSSYERLSAEFHLNIPLINLMNIPLLFSFNYRTYDELGASDVIQNANLEKYRLRTYSLSKPTGLFVSYSSGRLPFGFEEQQVVELGFKTHF